MFQLGGEFIVLVHLIANERQDLLLIKAILDYLELLSQGR